MAIDQLPPLATMGIGSAATPGWLYLFRERLRDGNLGPVDVEEAFDDATRLAIRDQVEAGIDVVSDGELRRMRFVFELYDRLDGLRRLPVPRRLGPPGYDRAPAFIADRRVTAPSGFAIVSEYRRLVELCPDRPLKAAIPGPLTIAGNLLPGADYGSGRAAERLLLDDLAALVAGEVAALHEAGCRFIQIDEPGFANPPFGLSPADGAGFVNMALAGFGDATAVHVCFGNNASRPYVRRDMGRLMDGMRRFDCALLLLEFANREMADLELLPELAERFRIAAGVVDVKSFHRESAEEVAGRGRRVLRHVPAERLFLTADCGFSAIPRGLARHKMDALAAGARLLRTELGLGG